MNITYYFYFLIILFLPTFIANAIPVIVKNIIFIKNFNKPINEKLFWKNKTYRWFITGVIFAILTSMFLFFIIKNFPNTLINNFYIDIVPNIYIAIFLWLIQWFWALFWDLLESFIKRKLWKKPWEAWPFWDWVDYIIWSLILFSFIFTPNIVWIIFLILFAPIISLTSNIIAYLLWWKNVWY